MEPLCQHGTLNIEADVQPDNRDMYKQTTGTCTSRQQGHALGPWHSTALRLHAPPTAGLYFNHANSHIYTGIGERGMGRRERDRRENGMGRRERDRREKGMGRRRRGEGVGEGRGRRRGEGVGGEGKG